MDEEHPIVLCEYITKTTAAADVKIKMANVLVSLQNLTLLFKTSAATQVTFPWTTWTPT